MINLFKYVQAMGEITNVGSIHDETTLTVEFDPTAGEILGIQIDYDFVDYTAQITYVGQINEANSENSEESNSWWPE